MSFGGVNTFQQYSKDFGLGHNGVRISFNNFDGFPDPSILNSLASNDLKLIFKSLLKRDETTKEKAVNDLFRLVENFSENETLFSSDIFFLCWSQVYPKLLVSESKAIRVYSHLITSRLVKLLKKKVSTFLRDVMPLLLLGTCDTDSSVSKACNGYLNDIFDNNEGKLNSLWSVFQEDILKLVDELIVKENEESISDERFVGKEDSLLRFNRLVTSAVQLLTSLIKSGSFHADKYEEISHEILISEDLWQLLSLRNTQFLKTYEAALLLQKSLFLSGFFEKHRDVLKLSMKKLLKSLSQINDKNSLKVAHLSGSIVDNLAILSHYRKGKIWTYDKLAKERFIRFVTIASRNPFPGFFSSLYKLYEESSSFAFLDNEHDWLPLWRGSNEVLREKSFLGRYGPELLGEFWINYRKFIGSCTVPGATEIAKQDALGLLRSNKDLLKLPALKTALINLLDPQFLASEIKSEVSNNEQGSDLLLGNLVLLLCLGIENSIALQDVASAMLEVVSKDQDTFDGTKHKAVKIYTIFVRLNIASLSDQIAKFAYELPTLISEDTYQSLSAFIVDYSKSTIAHNDQNFVTVVEDFLTAATSAGIANPQILKVLNLLDGHFSLSVKSSTVVQEFVEHYIHSYRYNDDGELFNGNLIDERTVVQLYEKSVTTQQTDLFLHYISRLNKQALEALLTGSSFLSDNLFGGSLEQTERLYQILKPLLDSDAIVQSLVDAIVLYAKLRPQAGVEDILLRIAEEVVTLKGHSLALFLPSDMELEFTNAVPFIDHRLALVSSLKLNTHLLEISSNELNLSQVENLVKYGLFLDALISRLSARIDSKLVVFLTMLCDLAEDFNCLSEDPQEKLGEYRNTLFKREYNDFSFEEAVDLICTNDAGKQFEILSLLISESSSVSVTCYHIRILQKILQNKADSISHATFTRKFPAIEKFVTSTLRTKEESSHRYLLCGTILSATEKFTELEIYARLRNVLAAECIGVKESELLEKSYKNLILLTNLLQSHCTGESTPPISSQRLNMMLSSLSQWQKSDLAYEPEFGKVRLVLLRLCALLARVPSVAEASSTLYELSLALLSDSLSMCLLDDTGFLFELRLYCLLLHEELSKGNGKQYLRDSSEEMLSSLIELSLVNLTVERNNQVSAVYYRTLSKVLNSYRVSEALGFYSGLLSAFLKNEDRHNINRSRLLFIELRKLVIERQKDAFLEFEFDKQKKALGEDNTGEETTGEELDVNVKLQLPSELLDGMCNGIPEDYLESEDVYGFLKYLWLWDLAFCFFRDASYDLRQKFIDQLKGRKLITTFFDFISDQIDLQDSKFWSDAGPTAILDYSAQSNDFSPYNEDVYCECKKLLGHSMYNMFLNVGSLTSSWWLNIKDRTLQTKIEKFVATFISPILISQELEEVAEKTSNLESNDTSLTIKINKVTNEVKASYLIDEQKLELSFRLPANYPLTNVQVVGVSRVGISEQKWKQWILSTQRVITGMNGSVVDSLDLFSKNVNLQFSGFEECAICYSILHVVDRKLPTKTCPTCNNKFHGACLYKWFRSSGNNTCPLCRSEIPFRR